jgi:tetratricopeptide (TPR) repeat protein
MRDGAHRQVLCEMTHSQGVVRYMVWKDPGRLVADKIKKRLPCQTQLSTFNAVSLRYNVKVASRTPPGAGGCARVRMARLAPFMTDIRVTTPTPAQGRREDLGARRWVLLGAALFLLLIIVLGGSAFGGYQVGMAQLAADSAATRSYEVEHQYALGLDDLNHGRFELAAARFEYVLQLDPNFRDAGDQLARAQAGLAITPTARPSPAATRAATATVGPTRVNRAAAIFEEAQARFADSDWDGVIEALAQLDSVDRNYEAVRADGMLFLALRNRGVERIQGDAIEAGIFDLDTAEHFGPLDTEAVNLRSWARTYLAGRSYWGLDWPRTMEIFEELSLVAPYFRDTDKRLFTAVVMVGDQLAAAGDYCTAAERYSRALLIRADEDVSAKLATAQENCASAPPPSDEGATPPAADGTPSP